tara:strand:+ start:1104 stop:1484 length:381 start_codon:yes stop_codon:yes gene_type:complete
MSRDLLSKYFSLEELDCRCGRRKGHYCITPTFDEDFLYTLDRIRERWDKPIRVSSGLRCKYWNAYHGGKKNSQHLLGKAIDLKIKIHEMLDFLDLVRGYKKITGIGLSKHFVHLDCAPGKRRFWIY